jgi:hypothetical protein
LPDEPAREHASEQQSFAVHARFGFLPGKPARDVFEQAQL